MTDFAANNNRASEDEGPAADAAQEAVALAKENSELKDRVLRTLAEMENLRRRTEREVADSRVYAIQSFARDLVGVADNIQRALDAVRDSGVAGSGRGGQRLQDCDGDAERRPYRNRSADAGAG